VILDTYYYLRPKTLLRLRISGREVLFLEGHQLKPILRALTERCLKVLEEAEERVRKGRPPKFYRLIRGASEEEDVAAILFLASESSGVRLDALLKEREKRLRLTAERIWRLLEMAPWARREHIERFLEREVGEIARATLKIGRIESPSRGEVRQFGRAIQREICSIKCPGRSPDSEDLKMVLALRRVNRLAEVFVIPEEKECLGCVLERVAEREAAYSHVEMRRPSLR